MRISDKRECIRQIPASMGRAALGSGTHALHVDPLRQAVAGTAVVLYERHGGWVLSSPQARSGRGQAVSQIRVVPCLRLNRV